MTTCKSCEYSQRQIEKLQREVESLNKELELQNDEKIGELKELLEKDSSVSLTIANEILDLIYNGGGCMECGNYFPTLEEIDNIVKNQLNFNKKTR